ncbi:hypothetical protein PoB_006266700, partial [Plakobranchus ocellatus]
MSHSDEVRPVDVNLREQMWEMEASKQKKATSVFTEGVTQMMKLMSKFDALIGGETEESYAKDTGHLDTIEKQQRIHQAIVEGDLDDQLARVDEDLKKKQKPKKRRHTTGLAWAKHSKRAVVKSGKSKSGRYRRESQAALNILPYKTFVGGDFSSVFDTMAIDLAAAMKPNLPKTKLVVVHDSPGAVINTVGEVPLPPLPRIGPDHIAPGVVEAAVLTGVSEDDEVETVTADDITDDLINDNDDLIDEKEEEVVEEAVKKMLRNKPLPG